MFRHAALTIPDPDSVERDLYREQRKNEGPTIGNFRLVPGLLQISMRILNSRSTNLDEHFVLFNIRPEHDETDHVTHAEREQQSVYDNLQAELEMFL